MVGLSPLGGKVLVVDDLSEQNGCLVQPVDGDEILHVPLGVLRTQLEVPPVHPDGRLLDARVGLDELDVRLPDALVLRDGQRAEGAVEDSPQAGDLALLHQECRVVQPDPGHLVHEDERSLEGAVDLLEARVGDAARPHLLAPRLQVVVPQLVGSGQLLERPLVHHVERRLSGPLLPGRGGRLRRLGGPVRQVPRPGLERLRVPQQLLLEGQVVVGEHDVLTGGGGPGPGGGGGEARRQRGLLALLWRRTLAPSLHGLLHGLGRQVLGALHRQGGLGRRDQRVLQDGERQPRLRLRPGLQCCQTF